MQADSGSTHMASLLSITKYFGIAKHKCWLTGILVCCKYECVMRTFSSVFRVYYETHDGPVTSTYVLHYQSFLGSIINDTKMD